MKNQYFWCIIARVSAPFIKQAELPFSIVDEVLMLRDDNRFLKEKLAAALEDNQRLRCQLFGSKSERMEPGSFEIEVEEQPEPPVPEEKVKGPEKETTASFKRTRRLKVRYRKVVEETLVPQEVQDNPTAYERLAESCNKIVRRVERVPAHLVLHNYICPGFVRSGKRGKTKQDAPIYAAAPGSILPGSNMDASIVAHVIHGKFNLHLPLYRQIKELERQGLEGASEGVLCNWMRAGANALEPLWKAKHGLMLGSEALHVDETPIRCLKSTVHNGTMWAMSSADDGMTFYYWRTSRSKDVLNTLLREGMSEQGAVYSGTIISDGYEGYASWRRELAESERPAWQACWAHVRRKFVEGARNSSDPAWCRKVVEHIRPLYRIEHELRESKAPPEEVAARRANESREHVAKFFRMLEERAKDTTHPATNNLRKAINYALERRAQLVSWLDNPAVPIDNNAVERAIRPLTVGRKNSLFIGSPDAGKYSAILYTMVEECRRVNVDSEAWLTEALRRLPNYRGDYLDLLPGILPLPGTPAAGETQI